MTDLPALVAAVWSEAKAIDATCPCRTGIPTNSRDGISETVCAERGPYRCCCAWLNSDDLCHWPGHDLRTRLRVALVALVET